MGFLTDLAQGEAFELAVADALLQEYGIKLQKNSEKTGVDLVHELLSIEVKFDRGCRTTGNIFIEIGFKGNESGIYKGDFDIYIQGDYDGFWIFKANKLRADILNWVEEGTFRVVNGGDGWKSKGILLPTSFCNDYAIKYIKLNTLGQHT